MYINSLAFYILAVNSWKYILFTIASKDMKSLGTN